MVETEPIIKAAAHGNDNDVYFNGFSVYVLDGDFDRDTWITLFTGGYGPRPTVRLCWASCSCGTPKVDSCCAWAMTRNCSATTCGCLPGAGWA
ncbi:hypothetical protein [Kocuria atrinae]|uniref:hypothetical protein n=1 Tax=Kocuria atrinae TaxID=592377 RepID=UPI001CB8E917|nr:hypothetical protein [Kocuria atrinae]